MPNTRLIILLCLAVLLLCFSLFPRHHIEIVGSSRFTVQIKRALALIKEKAPEDFKIIEENIQRIEESAHSGMDAVADKPTFYFTEKSAFESLTWCIGDIAHDSWHSKLYHDYKKQHGLPVPDNVWQGRDIEKECMKHQIAVLKKVDAPETEINYICSLDGSYADVAYSERNW
jgi:hypothetical protein